MNSKLDIQQLSGVFESEQGLSDLIGWEFDYLPLEPGRPRFGVCAVILPSISMSEHRYQYGVRQRFLPPPNMDTVSFGFLRDGVAMIYAGREIKANTILDFNTYDELEVRSYAGFEATSLSVNRHRLEYTAECLGISISLGAVGPSLALAKEVDIRKLRRLRMALARARAFVNHCGLSNGGMCAPIEVEGEIYQRLAECLEYSPANPHPSRPRQLNTYRRAVSFLEEHARDAVSIADICGTVGVTNRTLERTFERVLGISPKQYLQYVRLRGVRAELRKNDPESKVCDIAANWGYWHAGQFAAEYNEMFGELPSTTLAQT